jgi:hypothetical protein
MMLGGTMRNPSVKVDHGLVAYNPLEVSEFRREALRDREIHREGRLGSKAGGGSRLNEQTFEAGDWARMRAETPVAEAKRRGVPLKWVYRWDDRGTVVGPVEGHPNQFMVRKASSGQEVKRSAATLCHSVPEEEMVGDLKSVGYEMSYDLGSTFFSEY